MVIKLWISLSVLLFYMGTIWFNSKIRRCWKLSKVDTNISVVLLRILSWLLLKILKYHHIYDDKLFLYCFPKEEVHWHEVRRTWWLKNVLVWLCLATELKTRQFFATTFTWSHPYGLPPLENIESIIYHRKYHSI